MDDGSALVRLASQKWDGSFHRAAQRRALGVDGHGVWFGSRPGDLVWWSDGREVPVDDWSVICYSAREWWRATWYARDGDPVMVYVDIGRMPTGDPRDGFVDLDLDVEGPADGPYDIIDRDEFTDNADRYRYPRDVVGRVERTALEVVASLGEGLGGLGAERLCSWRRDGSAGNLLPVECS